jgi:three-Cys-motif partner protein
LCILDPYGLHLNWTVIAAAGQMKTMDIFLNFPVADINRNVLWRDPEGVDDLQKARMTAFWGEDSWRNSAYQPDLFGNPDKQSNEAIAEAFRKRLKEVAGFARVPKPVPMRNSNGAIVYYSSPLRKIRQNTLSLIYSGNMKIEVRRNVARFRN